MVQLYPVLSTSPQKANAIGLLQGLSSAMPSRPKYGQSGKGFRDLPLPVPNSSSSFRRTYWARFIRALHRLWSRSIHRVHGNQYSATTWRNADHAHRRLARISHRCRALRAGAGEVTPTAPPNAAPVPAEDGPIAVDERPDDQSSLASFGSDDSRTDPVQVGELSIELVKAERDRRKAQSSIGTLKAELRAVMRDVIRTQADIRQEDRRRTRANIVQSRNDLDDATRMQAEHQETLNWLSGRKQNILRMLYSHEERLSKALLVQEEGEPRLFRAIPGFIRIFQRQDPGEKIDPRSFRIALRAASDIGRNVLRERRVAAARTQHRPPHRIVVEDGSAGFNLVDSEETRIREANYRDCLDNLYRTLESKLTELGVLEPEGDGEATGQTRNAAPSYEGQATRPLGERLFAPRKSLATKNHNLEQWRLDYANNHREYLMTYANDGEPGSDDEDRSPAGFFDREYLEVMGSANKSIRNAELEHFALRNQALEEKFYDKNEADLFGLLDHQSDGYTGTENTSWRRRRAVRAAGLAPALTEWVRAAGGRGYMGPEAPSVIADIPSADNASVRYARSQEANLVSERALIDRWEAERVVMRGEIPAQMRKLEQDIAAGTTGWWNREFLMTSGVDMEVVRRV